MTARSDFTALHPQVFPLEEQLSPELTQLLVVRGWIQPDEPIRSVQKPGEGNMNVVMRVRTDRRSLILKQARPWVQKYPQVAAPLERVAVEAAFYRQLSDQPSLSGFTPNLIGFDPEHFLLALEDLGEGADLLNLYQPEQTIPAGDVADLTRFLSALHTIQASDADPDFPENRAMRQLNHEHIFRFPFQSDTGFDLDSVQPGLQALASPLRDNDALRNRVAALGEVYLQRGPVLIHGDYYPGSWLNTPGGIRIIDPEFGFFGRAEFDLGVMLAHLKLARQGEAVQEQILKQYQPPTDFDPALLRAFTGTEIIRRLIGLAQLPLPLSVDEKEALLEEAVRLVLEAA